MAFFTLGINHQTAPVEIREKLAFNRAELPQALAALRDLPEVEEVVLLSTCNRTEVYCAVDGDSPSAVLDWLASARADMDPGVRDRFYTYSEDEVVRHLLRVACGLDSLVIGEPQIFGQLKQAYDDARTHDTVGPLMHRLFQYGFSVAKQVRTETAIGANAVSVAYAAVNLARQIFGDLNRHTALLIGAGETIELAASYLHDRKLARMIVANRTAERAQEVASRYKGFAIPLDEIGAHVGEADIVIASTASPDVILTRKAVEKALAGRKHRPIFMVDIAVPRDIESSVGELDDVYLYTVDDLQGVIEENRASREQAAQDAEEIVEAKVSLFLEQLHSLDAVPLIRGLRDKGEAEKRRALEKAERMLAAGKPADEVMLWLANTLTNRLLHAPTSTLRDAASELRPDLVRAARELFELDETKQDKDPSEDKR
ncbi:MAG: glutamyl-tRNA reductase [Gammaproteobacteria bacterium]|nr:glutamyl-tRNA reductase [Gammaproteobacteria bacterium]